LNLGFVHNSFVDRLKKVVVEQSNVESGVLFEHVVPVPPYTSLIGEECLLSVFAFTVCVDL
jgi:hypothetical protein